MKTIYISDLDGTLLSDSAKIRPRTADMLNEFISRGGLFSYCTARSAFSAAKITADISFNIPVILMNGVFIYDQAKDEYIHKCLFDKEQTALVEKAVREYGEEPLVDAFIGGSIKNSFVRGSKSLEFYTSQRSNESRLRPLDSYDGMFDGECFYAVFINPVHKEELDRIFTEENGFRHTYYADSYDRSRHWYEVFSSEAGKAQAVMKLREIVGADELVSFGDNSNDLPMFAVSDRCYAVGNAIPEVKAAADAVIETNESYGVPLFIEKDSREVFDYESPQDTAPDNERFAEAVSKALSRERSTIGTLNEKAIHNALKCYYCPEQDHEARIGSFYADAAGENGIFEIQTAGFSKLRKKLSVMLGAAHVTVVYPFSKITHTISVNENTGEVLSVTKRTENSFSKFFLELYRIKAFLTDPNLTVRIAFLETEKRIYYKDNKKTRGRELRKEKLPLALLDDVVLEKPADYLRFVPDELPENFTAKDYKRAMRSTDASLALSVLEMLTTVKRIGKKGSETLYTRSSI